MKILFAPDCFKGSMSSTHVIDLLYQITEQHFPGCEMLGVQMGDGGEGTADALIHYMGGFFRSVSVKGPLGETVQARYGILDDSTAIVEMAQASGLTLVPANKLNVMKASSYGTGELIGEVIRQGYRTVYLLLGGSATNDGGIGAAAALGIDFFDEKGVTVAPNASGLAKVRTIDSSRMMPELKEVKLKVMCDVKNPLLGKNGATYVYGKQKGATEKNQAELEAGMFNYVEVMEKTCGKSMRDVEGAGAAGGVVIPFMAFSNAEMCSGIQTVLQLINFDKLLDGVNLVVTGEGRLDSQSVKGKVLSGIGQACKNRNIPAVAIVGGIAEGGEEIFNYGINSVISCVNDPMSLDEAVSKSDKLFLQAADQMYRFIKLGMSMQKNSIRTLAFKEGE